LSSGRNGGSFKARNVCALCFIDPDDILVDDRLFDEECDEEDTLDDEDDDLDELDIEMLDEDS
jgi:hypothetical protein